MNNLQSLIMSLIIAVISYGTADLILFLFPLDQWWGNKVTPWNMVAVMVWLLVVPDLIRDSLRGIRVKKTFLSQSVVDRELCRLAIDFDSACKAQVALQGEMFWKANLSKAEAAVQQAKDSFWKAHALAKELGFKVHERYSDYLA